MPYKNSTYVNALRKQGIKTEQEARKFLKDNHSMPSYKKNDIINTISREERNKGMF